MEIGDIRETVRTRGHFVEISARCKSRVLELLEISGYRLSNVMSGVFGVTGVTILSGLLAGRTPEGIVLAITKTEGESSRFRGKG